MAKDEVVAGLVRTVEKAKNRVKETTADLKAELKLAQKEKRITASEAKSIERSLRG